MILTNLLLIPLSVLALHEAGHAAMAIARGLHVRGVVVNRHGIGVRREAGTQRDTFWIALAGPLANLLAAVIGWSVPEFRAMNIALAVLNLLPLKGSDGSKVLASMRRAPVAVMPTPVARQERKAA